MGFHVSGDAYTRRYDDFTKDVPRKTRCVDDSLLWDRDIRDAFWDTLDYIKLCADNGVVFNPSKFVFGEDEVNFAGYNITNNGIRPTEHILSAITDFPTSTDITRVQSWFGLVNLLAYAFSQSATMAPFRELLKVNPLRFTGTNIWTEHSSNRSGKLSQWYKTEAIDLSRRNLHAYQQTGAKLASDLYFTRNIVYVLPQTILNVEKIIVNSS